MLKLFRDFLFHSVTEDGRPWLDHAHIVQCLNKLDAGSIERVSCASIQKDMWNVERLSVQSSYKPSAWLKSQLMYTLFSAGAIDVTR